MIMVRYADNLVVGFQREADARRFWEAIRERLQEFSLMLQPEKTRLIEFGRFAAAQREKRGLRRSATTLLTYGGARSGGAARRIV